MRYKTIELKADDLGTISGYFSTYEKTPDSYGDIIEPGAFTETIKAREESGHPFPLCFNHDFSSVIGAVDSIEEQEKGPFITAHFLDIQQAQDVRKMVQSGAIYQFSFAYDVLGARKPTDEESKAGVTNVLTKLEVFEISVVTVPANQNAEVTEIKSGRRNSKKDADAIKEAIALLQGVLDDKEDEQDNEEPKANDNAQKAAEDLKADENTKTRAAALIEKINQIKEGSDNDN